MRIDVGTLERVLQAFEENLAHRQAAVIGIGTFDDMPRRVIATGAAQHPLAIFDEFVVSL
ncbi:hypothetical protein D3C78_1933070 [compost metagenome]